MYPTTIRTLAAAFAAGTFAITAGTACGGDDTAPIATEATATPDTEATPDSTATPDTGPGEIADDPEVGPASPLPTADADAVRDELIELAEDAPFGTGSGPDFTIIESWLAEYPALERSLFDDQPATATSISASSAFLMEDVTAPGEQAFAWAVLGADGTCAGAVAVIPGNPDGSVSDSGLPTVFAPVDDLASCTARAAIEALAAR